MIVAHLDLDAFYAAVEELENPELRAQPLVVGGDPRGRGVVATANYVARRFGIHSAMSCAEALRRCPQAVFVRPRHTLYREYSRSVWETVRGVVPTVEQTGMDEGYLDIGEVAADFLAARVVAEAVRTAVRAATSLTCSLGVAPCKVVAKVASDARKPGGLVVVPAGKEAAFLAPLAVRRLPGVGPKAEERLRAAEIETIGDLAALTDDDLRRLLPGSVGTMLRDRARGIDPRELELGTERISISVENTFERDISDRERLHDELRGMAAEVAGALQRKRPGRAHGDDEAPLRGLLHPQPLDLARERDRRARDDRRPRLPPPRPRPARPARARCVSSASASPASPTSASSRWTLSSIAAVEGFPFVHEETVRFSDLDGMGHVNNAVFLTYLEQARLAWFRSYGEEESMPLTDVILAHTEIDFRLPLVFGETVSVGVRPSRLGTKSFELEYELRVGERLVAEARSVLVGYDYDAGQSTEVPERWRRRVESAEIAAAAWFERTRASTRVRRDRGEEAASLTSRRGQGAGRVGLSVRE